MWGFSCGEKELLPFQSKGWARLSENGQRTSQGRDRSGNNDHKTSKW